MGFDDCYTTVDNLTGGLDNDEKIIKILKKYIPAYGNRGELLHSLVGRSPDQIFYSNEDLECVIQTLNIHLNVYSGGGWIRFRGPDPCGELSKEDMTYDDYDYGIYTVPFYYLCPKIGLYKVINPEEFFDPETEEPLPHVDARRLFVERSAWEILVNDRRGIEAHEGETDDDQPPTERCESVRGRSPVKYKIPIRP